jgi:SAM-dependent methyltransferase
MSRMIDFAACPSCRHEPSIRLAPPGVRIDTTLDLIDDDTADPLLGLADFAALRDIDFVICPRCALIYMPRRSTPAAARDYYARLFHRLETPLPYGDLPLPERFVRRHGAVARDLIRTLAAHGVLDGVTSVLYVRCNAGEGPRLLRDEHRISDVYALEVLPSCIRHAREVYGLPHVEPLLAPEFENPFSRRKFDLVICDEGFGHAHDPVCLARTLADSLSEGGVIVAFNEKDHSQILKSAKLFPYGMNFFHKQLFTRRSLRIFLELQGFAIEALPHPVVGKSESLKNSKILYLLRPGGKAVPELPSDEVASLAYTFSRWSSAHKWRRRKQRVLSAFRTRASEQPGFGGAARR